MLQQQRLRAFQVACAYVGTVVGAGFASGREIYQFFVRFGSVGFLSACLVLVLFAWIGFRMMNLGRTLRAQSFREMNAFLFGSRYRHVMDAVALLMLFGVTVAMLAGAGQLFTEQLHLPFQIGVLFALAITCLTLLHGMSGLLRANAVIVPVMVAFVLFAGLHTFHRHGVTPALHEVAAYPIWPNVLPALVSAITYTALNVGLSAGVLIPLGHEIADERVLRLGAIWGAGGLVAMILVIMFTLATYSPFVLHFGVPMGYVAQQMGHILQYLFVTVLFGEIYSTLVGNVYALLSPLRGLSVRLRVICGAGLGCAAFLLSQIGFKHLVAYAYPAFGWLSLVMIFALLWPRHR